MCRGSKDKCRQDGIAAIATKASAAACALLEKDGREDVSLLVGLGALYGAFDADAGMDGFMTGFAFPRGIARSRRRCA